MEYIHNFLMYISPSHTRKRTPPHRAVEDRQQAEHRQVDSSKAKKAPVSTRAPADKKSERGG